ncbi:GH3 family protein [Hibiscus syriacus]|uniref:GH3 family protein n=1 Tax=Hibiscus syriacus TaxID=106335 RepID=A0A6A2ZK92_HIBSY|nr:GH3 family protein [Hibiscus syriacus]
MFKLLNKRIKCLCFRLRWPVRRQSKPVIVIKRLGKISSKARADNGSSKVHQDGQLGGLNSSRPIRIATFNASLFFMAPAMPEADKSSSFDFQNGGCGRRSKSTNDRPKSILKQSPLHPNSMNYKENLSRQKKYVKSRLRVSIDLPHNEISLLRNRQLSFAEELEKDGSSSRTWRGKTPLRNTEFFGKHGEWDVKAEEEKAMKPFSDLAAALGMNYVCAESWAPEYGNAVLSKWPIKLWKVQKIFDDTDFRNILKATIDVPETGEVNFHGTHLDHLDENWRMKQINAIIQSNDGPHILAGGLNSLEKQITPTKGECEPVYRERASTGLV